MDLCIQYGITDSSAEVEQYEINFPALRDIEKGISKSIQRAIQKEYTAIIQDDGSVNEKTLARIVLSVGEDSLLNHGDIREMLDQNVNGEYDEKVKAAMRTAVEQGLPALLQDVNVKRKRLMPSIDVCVSSEELAKLPEDAIHTLRFKVSPNNINIYLKDE